MNKKLITILTAAAIVLPFWGMCAKPDALMTLLAGELEREQAEFAKTEAPPYYICYRVNDEVETGITATEGALMQSYSQPSRLLTVQVRMGGYDVDSFREMTNVQTPQPTPYNLAGDDNPQSIRRTLWIATNNEYNKAVAAYNQIQAGLGMSGGRGYGSDYTPAEPAEYYDKPLSHSAASFDMAGWTERLKRLSAAFKPHKEIQNGTATISRRVTRNYFASTEGVRIIENRLYTVLMVSASVTADDGMEIPLTNTYFAQRPEELPSEKAIAADIEEMVRMLKELRKAKTIDPYSGPALLAGGAAGVFFHEIFGHRVEGQRMKSGTDGQTFRRMVGQPVLPETVSVYDDPTIERYNGEEMYGSYKYDEEGVRGNRVTVVDNGVLRDFLMTRVPMDGFTQSNGHGRAVAGKYPVSRQSNLLVESSSGLTSDDMRRLLIEEAREQGKEFGLLFVSVEGGFTNATKFQPSAFNVFPNVVYKVYTDGRPDELVRGIDIVGTPLAIFSSIVEAGGAPQTFTGLCGAESGSVPVTATAPDILVKKMEVQKKSRNPLMLPLLPRPY